MYHEQAADGQYRREGNHLYKREVDQHGRASYIHVYQDPRAAGLKQLIAGYESYAGDDE